MANDYFVLPALRHTKSDNSISGCASRHPELLPSVTTSDMQEILWDFQYIL
jgi:hypothetical protein